MRPLKIRNAMAGHRKLTTTNWEQSSKLILLKLHQKLPKNSTPTILWPFSIWSKLERWKSSISECPMSWSKTKKKKKIIVLKCHLLLFFTATTPISCSDCDMEQKVDFIWQLEMTSSVAGPRRSSKPLPKAKLALKKMVMVTVWWSATWSDPLQFPESWQNYYIWEVCSAKQWDTLKTAMLAASTGQQNGPNPPWNAQLHITQPTHQNLNELGYEVLPHTLYLPDLSPTDNHFFKYLDNFLQE